MLCWRPVYRGSWSRRFTWAWDEVIVTMTSHWQTEMWHVSSRWTIHSKLKLNNTDTDFGMYMVTYRWPIKFPHSVTINQRPVNLGKCILCKRSMIWELVYEKADTCFSFSWKALKSCCWEEPWPWPVVWKPWPVLFPTAMPSNSRAVSNPGSTWSWVPAQPWPIFIPGMCTSAQGWAATVPYLPTHGWGHGLPGPALVTPGEALPLLALNLREPMAPAMPWKCLLQTGTS